MERQRKSSKKSFAAYMQKCTNLLLRLALWVGICFALNLGLLYFSQTLLGFYLKTPMGPEFIADNPELMATIDSLKDLGFEQLSLTLTLTAFAVCLGIMALCKFFYIGRYISPMGIVGRAIVCVLPLSAVVAVLIPEHVPTDGWEVAFGLAFFPTLVALNISFSVVDELLPEVDDVIAMFQKNDTPGKRVNGRR